MNVSEKIGIKIT